MAGAAQEALRACAEVGAHQQVGHNALQAHSVVAQRRRLAQQRHRPRLALLQLCAAQQRAQQHHRQHHAARRRPPPPPAHPAPPPPGAPRRARRLPAQALHGRALGSARPAVLPISALVLPRLCVCALLRAVHLHA